MQPLPGNKDNNSHGNQSRTYWGYAIRNINARTQDHQRSTDCRGWIRRGYDASRVVTGKSGIVRWILRRRLSETKRIAARRDEGAGNRGQSETVGETGREACRCTDR